MRDLYADLGVAPTASPEAIRHAYRNIAATCHPDKAPGDKRAAERFMHATVAKALLLDPAKRAEYDAMRQEGKSKGGKFDERRFMDLLSRTFMDLGPEFGALRAAAQAGDWIGVAVTTGKVGVGIWAMVQGVRGVLKAADEASAKASSSKQIRRKV